jgi:isopenicillin-N epimerase
MELSRRKLLVSAGLGLAAAASADLTRAGNAAPPARRKKVVPVRRKKAFSSRGRSAAAPWQEMAVAADWDAIRAQFRLDPEYIHMTGLLIASHPDPVREAIERHRQALDENPALYLQDNNRQLEAEVRQAAAEYLGARPAEIALTGSTTMGLGLVYNGLRVRSDQELLTSESDYYSTHESLRYKAAFTGATFRKVPLYRDLGTVSEDEIVQRLVNAIRPKTRVLALTWVHSSTGLKIPVRRIADAIARINAGRAAKNRVLLCVDGVHGLGVEDAGVDDLRCDFFIAGTHKWLFGPRGSGIIWGHPRSHAALLPIVPTFSRQAGWGGRMTPGGFKPFEHHWAMAEAFRFHQQLGRAQVAARIHAHNRQLKEGLAGMSHVHLYTPMDERLSAGITCFDVVGMSPAQVVHRLRLQKIVASITPYTPTRARLTPGLYNTPEEIEQVLSAVRSLG